MPVPREPSADLRIYAGGLHEMFVALTEAGFSEQQALSVLSMLMSTSRPPE